MASKTDIVWYFRVERRDTDGMAVVACAGRVSHQTGPDLESALSDAAAALTRGVVLDLSGVDYISSAGLRAVDGVSSRLTAGGRAFLVCGLTDAVAMAFSLAGLTGTLRIEPSLDAALAALATRRDPAR